VQILCKTFNPLPGNCRDEINQDLSLFISDGIQKPEGSSEKM
jgi:hypothetical protein